MLCSVIGAGKFCLFNMNKKPIDMWLPFMQSTSSSDYIPLVFRLLL